MTDGDGPWGPETRGDPRPTAPHGRFFVWLGLLVAVAAGVGLLARAFPGAVSTGEGWGWVARGFGLVALVSMGLMVPGRVRWRESARNAAIWAGIIGVLVLGATYRDELSGVVQRVRGEFSASYPVATGAHELVVTQDADGGFVIMGQVNGQPVRFLVDTGATDTVLSPADAHRLGLDKAALSFDHASETANGTGHGAPYVADSLAVGDIRFQAMPLVINQTPMTYSLLGMTFLKRLDSFQVRGRRLYLKSR